MPWSRDLQDVPCHFHMCLSRLKALQYRLLRDVDVLKVYDETIKDQLERGIVETVEVDHKGINQVHYLPHLPVVRSDRSTTKVRVVYDGSAKSSESNLSLNDCLQKGPNLIPKLFKVLVRFHSYPIAVTANIEKAFLMIEIEESDRDMLRFLWFSDPFDVKGEIQHLRFTRLVFGLKPSPAILGNVIGLHCLNFKTEYPDLVQLLDHSLYVDDLISGADTVANAFQLYQSAKKVMSAGGFNLRKWKSNSSLLRKLIEEEERIVEDESSLPLNTSKDSGGNSTTNKLLGVLWDSTLNEFGFQVEEIEH